MPPSDRSRDTAPPAWSPPSSPALLPPSSTDGRDLCRLAEAIAPGSQATELGGWMSRNLRLEPAGLVLRVHEKFVSRRRLLAVQQVRQRVAESGLTAAVALSHDGSTAFRCGTRWAEIEGYIPHGKLDDTWDSYAWMYRNMGTLHRTLRALDLRVPRPPTSIFAAPGTLRAWLPVAEAAVAGNAEATEHARRLRSVIGRLRRGWVSPVRLPVQLVHGDVKLDNFVRRTDGEAVYLDFGFAAHRPRIHDLAFSFTHSVLTVDGKVPVDPEAFPWHRVRQLVEEYEAGAGSPLSTRERRALAPYTAVVRTYYAAYAGFGKDPAEWLANNQPALRLSNWLLDHPEALSG